MRSETVKVVEQAVGVLSRLSAQQGGATVTELSETMGLGKSTVHRLLTALQNQGLVEQDPETHRYSLGYRIVELSASLLGQKSLVAQSTPYMRRLSNSTHETVSLHIALEGRRLCIAEVESQQELKFTYGVGRSRPLYVGASGKCILAYLPSEQQVDALRRLSQQSSRGHGMPDPATLRQELESIRRQGYAQSMGEVTPGVRSIAAPIFDRTGRVIASLGVVGPEFRFVGSHVQEVTALLAQMAAQISTSLGYMAQPAASTGEAGQPMSSVT